MKTREPIYIMIYWQRDRAVTKEIFDVGQLERVTRYVERHKLRIISLVQVPHPSLPVQTGE